MSRGPGPRSAVTAELLRALGDALLLPLRSGVYLATRGRQRRELAADLDRPAAVDPGPEPAVPTDRPLRVFLSCAETSGEIHAANLAGVLKEILERAGAPPPELVGLGGERLARSGVRCLADPISRAAMGAAVAANLGYYLRLLTGVARELRERPCDLVLPVDSPALHVPLGRIARRYGAPVVHLVTPQYWGWAPWRAGGYRRAVDLGLSILPFEPAWFARRSIPVAHVGHPLLDELQDVPAAREDAAGPTVALLPGSRASVIERNLPWMLAVLARTRLALPDLEVVLPCARPELEAEVQKHLAAAQAESWVRVQGGDLHGALARSRAALSVSGTVLLDLLHQRLPAVVVYRLGGPLGSALSRRLLTVPHFSSVNLLAGAEVYPEFCFHGSGPQEEVAELLVRALTDGPWRDACREGLERAARRLGPPGALNRAARHALGALGR